MGGRVGLTSSPSETGSLGRSSGNSEGGGSVSMGRNSWVVLTLVEVARPFLRDLLVVLTLTVEPRGAPLIVRGFREAAAFGIDGGGEVRWQRRRVSRHAPHPGHLIHHIPYERGGDISTILFTYI